MALICSAGIAFELIVGRVSSGGNGKEPQGWIMDHFDRMITCGQPPGESTLHPALLWHSALHVAHYLLKWTGIPRTPPFMPSVCVDNEMRSTVLDSENKVDAYNYMEIWVSEGHIRGMGRCHILRREDPTNELLGWPYGAVYEGDTDEDTDD